MPKAIRLGDNDTGHDACSPTALVSASGDVFINGKGAGRVGDTYSRSNSESCAISLNKRECPDEGHSLLVCKKKGRGAREAGEGRPERSGESARGGSGVGAPGGEEKKTAPIAESRRYMNCGLTVRG